jgi:hypothetical protein
MAEMKPTLRPSLPSHHIKQKRKKARVRTNIEGFYFLNKTPRSIPCNVIDLGTGGLTIQSGTVLYVGDKVTVLFNLENHPLKISGEIGRISGKNAVVRFDDLPPQELNVIQTYIHKVFYSDGKNDGE